MLISYNNRYKLNGSYCVKYYGASVIMIYIVSGTK